MRSHLYLNEKVENKDRKFGADPEYYPVTIHFPDGTVDGGLITEEQVQTFINRKNLNPEDFPHTPWWKAILEWFLV